MATLTKAEALLEELRSASYGAAQKDLKDLQAFAKEQVRFDRSVVRRLLSIDPLHRRTLVGYRILQRSRCVCGVFSLKGFVFHPDVSAVFVKGQVCGERSGVLRPVRDDLLLVVFAGCCCWWLLLVVACWYAGALSASDIRLACAGAYAVVGTHLHAAFAVMCRLAYFDRRSQRDGVHTYYASPPQPPVRHAPIMILSITFPPVTCNHQGGWHLHPPQRWSTMFDIRYQ